MSIAIRRKSDLPEYWELALPGTEPENCDVWARVQGSRICLSLGSKSFQLVANEAIEVFRGVLCGGPGDARYPWRRCSPETERRAISFEHDGMFTGLFGRVLHLSVIRSLVEEEPDELGREWEAANDAW